MTYSLHPDAEEDLREAARFYHDRAGSSLSLSLLSEFKHSVTLLMQYPALGAVWRHGKRRHLMRRFPYAIVYTVSSEEVRIWAVAHQSRRPGYWRGRK